VFSWLWFPNIRFTHLPTTISFVPSVFSPFHSLFVSGEDFQQSFQTEMSKAGKEADDYCSWGLLRVSRGGYTVRVARVPTYIQWNLFVTKLKFVWKTEIHYSHAFFSMISYRDIRFHINIACVLKDSELWKIISSLFNTRIMLSGI
jgi:hypothetical protein